MANPKKTTPPKPTATDIAKANVAKVVAEVTPPKAKAAKRNRSDLYASYVFQAGDVITLGSSTKAKVKGSMAEAKFALYGDLSNGGSTTVGDVLAKCKGEKRATFTNEDGKVVNLKPSIRWDWAHHLISINGARYEPKAS